MFAASAAACSMARKRATTARPNGGQPRAAAVTAAGLTLDDGLAEHRVDLLHQFPGSAIRHVHGATGRRNGAEGRDLLQELDLARSDAPGGVKVDAQAQRCHGLPDRSAAARVRRTARVVVPSPVCRHGGRVADAVEIVLAGGRPNRPMAPVSIGLSTGNLRTAKCGISGPFDSLRVGPVALDRHLRYARSGTARSDARRCSAERGSVA